jgi:hypothetical protein
MLIAAATVRVYELENAAVFDLAGFQADDCAIGFHSVTSLLCW